MSDNESRPEEAPNGSAAEAAATEGNEARAAAKRAFLEVSDQAQKYKQFMLKPLETKKLKASETLSRVKDFLPLLKQSTDKLLDEFKANPDELNIENVDEEDEHIEMNLAVVSEDSDDSDDDEDQYEEEESDDDEDEEDSDEEGPPDEEGDDDDDTVTKKPKMKDDQYLDLDLGFKVKDPAKLDKLKLPSTSKATGKKPLIQIIDPKTADDNGDDDQSQEAQ